MKRIAKIAFGFLTVAYPFAVYFGIQQFSIKQVALMLLALFVMRLFLFSSDSVNDGTKDVTKNATRLGVMAGICLVMAVLVFEQTLFLKLYPLLVSLVMLLTFVWTLLNPPSAIERIARKFDPNLSELGVKHTRQVTQAWCVFFILNGAIAAYTAFFSSMETWALYNGLISYLVIGLMFALEFVIRIIRQRQAGE